MSSEESSEDTDKYCYKCSTLLSCEEIKYCDDNELGDLCFGHYFCKNHWCECMPESTPWKWLKSCEICNRQMICKSCKVEVRWIDPFGRFEYEDMCKVCHSDYQKPMDMT